LEAVQDYGVEYLKVHPRNQEFFDDINGQAYEQFKASIKSEGVLTPLILSPDMTVLSGHQRLKACKELGISVVPVIIRQDVKAEEDKLLKLLVANFGRNNNNETKQRKVAMEYVKLRGNLHGGDRKSSAPMEHLKISLEQIAAELGVSETELRRMLDIEQKLTPEIIQMLDDGVFTKSTAARVITQLTKAEQEELITTYGKEILEGTTQKQMQEYVNKLKEKDDEEKKKLEADVAAKTEEVKKLKSDFDVIETKHQTELQTKMDVLKFEYQTKIEEIEFEYNSRINDLNEEYNQTLEERKQFLEEKNKLEKELKVIKETIPTPEQEYARSLKETTIFFCGVVNEFLEKVGGYAWVAEDLSSMSDLSKRSFTSALNAVRDWTEFTYDKLNNSISIRSNN